MQLVLAAFGRAINIELSTEWHGKESGDTNEPEFVNLARINTEISEDSNDAEGRCFGFGK